MGRAVYDEGECVRLLHDISSRTKATRLFCLSVVVGDGARVTSHGEGPFAPYQFYTGMFIKYFSEISKSGKLKKSGSIILRADDFAALGKDIEKELSDHGIPLASNDFS